MSKKITLKSGIKATLKEMSVDDFDKCMDAVVVDTVDGQAVIRNQFGLSTLWIRNGVENADDKFIEYEIASSTGSGSIGSGATIIARLRKSTVPPHHQSILSIQNTSSVTQILGVILMRETQ